MSKSEHRNCGPKSLNDLAKGVLTRYITSLEDVGDIEYRILAPVLRKISSPLQLKKLEANSPQLRGEDAELWKRFINRDFGAEAVDKYVPQNPQKWSKIYDKHASEAEKTSERAAESLRAQFTSLNSAKEEHRTRLVAARTQPAARSRFGGGGGRGWGDSSRNWDVKAGSKTKNIIERARKEAKEVSFFQGRNSKLAVPMHALKSGKVSRDMEAKIKRQEAPTQTEQRKRKAVVVEDDDDEGEEAAGGKPGLEKRVVKKRPAADPFMRPKKPVVPFAPVAKRW